MQKPLTKEIANQIYDILVKHNNSPESERTRFVQYFCGEYGEVFHEYRIGGDLNPGGKLYYQGLDRLYVDYYSEYETQKKIKIKQKIDFELSSLLKKI